MSNRISIISEGQTFMTETLSKNLQQAGFEVTVIAANVDDVERYREQTDFFLDYAGEYVSRCRSLFVYLKDVCSEDEKMISVIGYPQDIADVEEIVSSTYVALRIERPFDMKDLISKFEQLRETDETRKSRTHILLIDEMPITTGPKVMEMIRSEPDSEGIPIIFLTGKSDKESVMSVMALKPQGYMLKSSPKKQILDTIDNFFETRKWQV